MGFPKPHFPEWYYRFMVSSTKFISALMIAGGLIGAVATAIAALRGSENYDLWGVLFCLAFALLAYLFRLVGLRWYRFMYEVSK